MVTSNILLNLLHPLGQILVIFLEQRHFARVDKLDRVKVFFRFLGQDTKECFLVRFHLELDEIRAVGIERFETQSVGASKL